MSPENLTILITVGTCLLTGLITLVSLAGVGLVIWFVMRSVGQNQAVLKTGTPAQAVIQQVWQTGTYVNNNPQIGMQLEVRPPNGMPYAAQVNAIIPLVNIPQFQPGAVVPVKISPTDPTKVALDVYGR